MTTLVIWTQRRSTFLERYKRLYDISYQNQKVASNRTNYYNFLRDYSLNTFGSAHRCDRQVSDCRIVGWWFLWRILHTERFYVRNRETIHSLKQMIFQTSCERKSTQDCESTLEGPNYYLGEQCFGGDTFCYYQFGPVRYHFVFRSADYRIWRAYIDSVRRSGGIGYGMALK